jgi:trehalose 6-phosphate synthase
MAQQSGDTSQETSDSSSDPAIRRIAEQLTSVRRLIVVSNNGPLGFSESDSGELTPTRNAGRVSDVFDPISEIPITWVSGAPGAQDRKARENLASPDGILRSNVLPSNWKVRFVAPPRRVNHKFYNVICNPLLWFLLHRSWSPTFTPTTGAQEHDAWERGYRAVNEMFAEEVAHAAAGGPIAVISRDYQLMLVPGLVREKHPEAVIHHSFETPWPWPSDLEILPGAWRTQLLGSLLSADVISFPSLRDVTSFMTCANEHFGEHVEENIDDQGFSTLTFGGRAIRLSVNPPAVRSENFKNVTEFAPTQRFIGELTDSRIKHTFVTVDRIEPHKNLVRPINAFGELLKRHPDLADNVRYVLILTPGPAHISAYKRLSDEIRRAARRVNENSVSSRTVQIYEENNFYRAVAGLTRYDTLISVPVVEGLGRSALDGPLVNTANGTMILSENHVASDYYGDLVQQVGFTDTGAMTDAMAAAVLDSDNERSRKASELREIVSGRSPEISIKQILTDLVESENRR